MRHRFRRQSRCLCGCRPKTSVVQGCCWRRQHWQAGFPTEDVADYRLRLALEASAAVGTHGPVGNAVAVEQADGLREVARGHHHLMPRILQPTDDRPEDQDMR